VTYNLNSTQAIPAEGRLGTIAGRITKLGKSGVTKTGNPFAGFTLNFIERVPCGQGFLSQAVSIYVSGFSAAADIISSEAEVGIDAQVTGWLEEASWEDNLGNKRTGLRLRLASARFGGK
jgi:hypothetical protein